MTVREVSNTPEPNHLNRAREAEQKRTTRGGLLQSPAEGGEPADRVEISGEARALLHTDPEETIEEQRQQFAAQADLLVRRLLGESESDQDVREDRIAQVRQRLREAHYENPQVLWETARRLIEEILGSR